MAAEEKTLFKDNPAIKNAIKRRNLAQKQIDARNSKKETNKKDNRFDERGLPVPPGQNNKPKENQPAKNQTKKFNVGVSKGGVPFKEAFNHYKGEGEKTFTWNNKKYSTVTGDEKAAAEKKSPAKKSFRQKRAENLKSKIADENVGEGRKRRLKRRLGRVEKRMAQGKAGGGMMKSKMSSKGGKMGGKMPGGMKAGGMAKKGYAKGGAAFPDLTGDGKVTQKDILKGRGVSGMKKGGMAKKGYSKGGAAMKSKGGTKRGKPRGVGAALRGYGRAMK